jgi:hypothetical protein
VALLSINHKCTHPCLLLLKRKRCEAVEDDGARRAQPQLIAYGIGVSVSSIELYNSDRIVSFYVFIRILLLLFNYVYYIYEI